MGQRSLLYAETGKKEIGDGAANLAHTPKESMVANQAGRYGCDQVQKGRKLGICALSIPTGKRRVPSWQKKGYQNDTTHPTTHQPKKKTQKPPKTNPPPPPRQKRKNHKPAQPKHPKKKKKKIQGPKSPSKTGAVVVLESSLCLPLMIAMLLKKERVHRSSELQKSRPRRATPKSRVLSRS